MANRYENQECENYVSTTLTLLKIRREHGLPALINPYLVEKTQEYNQTQEEAFQSEEESEPEGEEDSVGEVTGSQDNQGDISREVVQVDGSSERQRQKKRKVDFDSEVLETSNLGGSTRQVTLKEQT